MPKKSYCVGTIFFNEAPSVVAKVTLFYTFVLTDDSQTEFEISALVSYSV